MSPNFENNINVLKVKKKGLWCTDLDLSEAVNSLIQQCNLLWWILIHPFSLPKLSEFYAKTAPKRIQPGLFGAYCKAWGQLCNDVGNHITEYSWALNKVFRAELMPRIIWVFWLLMFIIWCKHCPLTVAHSSRAIIYWFTQQILFGIGTKERDKREADCLEWEEVSPLAIVAERTKTGCTWRTAQNSSNSSEPVQVDFFKY